MVSRYRAKRRNSMTRTAELSPCGKYRYRLERIWNPALPRCAWLCLNPSTADAERDDPTVRKITGFSARLGYGGFVLFNLMALRATYPSDLRKHSNPRGPGNEAWEIAEACREVSTDPPIIAWGQIHRDFGGCALEVVKALKVARCLGYTKSDGQRSRRGVRMRCKYCRYDINLLTMTRHGVCDVCAKICDGLDKPTITSATVSRILNDIRPLEEWKATWGRDKVA